MKVWIDIGQSTLANIYKPYQDLTYSRKDMDSWLIQEKIEQDSDKIDSLY